MKNIFKFTPSQNRDNFKIKPAEPSPTYSKDINISSDLNKNVTLLKELLHFPKSNDIQFRFFDITINDNKYSSLLIFYDGLVNSEFLNNYILKQLMQNYSFQQEESKNIIKKKETFDIKTIILGSILAESQVSFVENYKQAISMIINGDALLLVDSLNIGIVCDVKKIPSRNVSKAENEMNINGPSEAFIENFRTNTALIRKFVKDENLIFETIEVGKQSSTKCAISYISTIANDSLIDEVRRRISSIDIDYLLDSGQLEQLIEDKTFLIDPLIISTERPDKVASHLIEGRVAIIVQGSSNVLVVPAMLYDFTHPSEDSYIRYPYSLLLRILRIPSIFLSIFLPGLYIAICNFHQEMLPTDMLFAIAGTKEKVPFSMLIELLIMEIAFEIIREASIRTPAPIGPTLRNCWYINLRSGNS